MTLIGDKVKRQLIARNKGLTPPKFYALSARKLMKLLMREVRPESPLLFLKVLDKSVDFDAPRNYVPSALDFTPLYNALLLYRNDFTMIVDILSEGNEENIPPITNKEGGLIHMFLKKIPFDYGKHVMQTIKQGKFKSIRAFLNEFYRVVEQHKAVFLNTKSMNQFFSRSLVFETPSKSSQRPSGFVKRHHVSEIAPVNGDSEQEPPSEHVSDDDYLTATQDDIREKEEPIPTVEFPTADSDPSDDQVSAGEERLQQLDNMVKAPVKILSRPKPTSGSELYKPPFKRESQGSTVCWVELFEGNCQNKNCPHSHDYAKLCRAHQAYFEKLQSSKYRPKGDSVRKVGSSFNMIQLSTDDSKIHELMQTQLIEEVPAAAIMKAVHHSGAIATMDGTTISVENALFDSGALSGSYINRRFVRIHKDALAPFRVKVQSRVKLADNETVLDLDEAYILSVTFTDKNGDCCTATIMFYVLPECNHQLIVGLPAIIKHFSALHTQMIHSVVDSIKNTLPEVSHIDEIEDLNNIEPGTLRYPWSYVQEEEAPEDVNTPLPCSFTDALHYMEMSTEDAIQEYFDLFPTHVDPKFAEMTNILELLRTKGVNVFVPQNWEGITGVPDIDLVWKPGLPDTMKPKARAVNPKLYEHAYKEFLRLRKYLYRDSDSPIASCLVIAPKATKPFIRFCGDYPGVNKYIEFGHYPILHVQHTLEKIIHYKIFLDFDLANSFHQFRLSPLTSRRLSVQTVWGQVEPIFMPEGIGPASGYLQKHLSNIFEDFVNEGWCIVIFDNLLAMANDYDDAYEKVEKVLDRCLRHNIYLKFSKTWLGYDHANFFGYVCREGCYELSQERKDTIQQFPFPTTLKKMQSFLGTALFFKSFVPHFSNTAAPLYDMVHKDFSWDESTWTVDYRQIFEDFKKALVASVANFYPNYELDWILRTDASRFGIGAVLLQVLPATDGTDPVYQPIAFFSEKFSDQATRWSTIEQEAYGIYAAVKHFAYYLTCKPFTLETDHNNLLFMEQSLVPKIIRWRVYLQSFSFMLRHIPGKMNVMADWLSRWHERDLVPPAPILASLFNAEEEVSFQSPEEVFRMVHGGRMGHHGARRTWKWLNEHFPGHKIPYRVIEELVATCPTCQKLRLGMVDGISRIVRHLKPAGRRSAVGIDTLTVTPEDSEGFKYIFVMVNHFTKYSVLHPSKKRDAENAALALFSYFACFGLVDEIYSDPGTEFANEIVETLNKWVGVRHKFGLVERHESNGVEGTNKQVLRHLAALVLDERMLKRWRELLPAIQFMLNSVVNSETGVIPFEAHFGSQDFVYFRLPEGSDSTALAHSYIQALNENLQTLFELSKRHQDEIIKERTAGTPPEKQNMYQPGDFVLWQANPDEPLPSKLSPKFIGPYIVLEQVKNAVSCKHVIQGYIKNFDVERLKIFHGDLEAAKKVAIIDNDQYTIRTIHSYRGDPMNRRTMDFLIEYEDGDKIWIPWSKDLFDSIPYEKYCRSVPELTPLVYTVEGWKQNEKLLNSKPISDVVPGDICFVDLRFLGHLWYDHHVPLPDKFSTLYLLEGHYFVWENKKKTKISIKFPVLNEVFVVSNDFIQRYGYRSRLPDKGYVLVDEKLINQTPVLAERFPKRSKRFRA